MTATTSEYQKPDINIQDILEKIDQQIEEIRLNKQRNPIKRRVLVDPSLRHHFTPEELDAFDK